MNAADYVLYRRMRGIFWGLLVCGVLVLPQLFVLAFAVPAQLGMYPDELLREVGRPGQLIAGGFGIATLLGFVTAVVLGSTAGSIDLQHGVLRDVVLAGRPRWRVVLGRLVAGVVVLLGFLALSLAVTTALALTLAPIDADVSWHEFLRDTSTILRMVGHTMPFVAGIAMLIGSRGPAIVVYFVVVYGVDGLLSSIPTVRDWWQHVSLVRATDTVDLAILDQGAQEADLATAIAVVVGWTVVPFAAGLVRLTRRDL